MTRYATLQLLAPNIFISSIGAIGHIAWGEAMVCLGLTDWNLKWFHHVDFTGDGRNWRLGGLQDWLWFWKPEVFGSQLPRHTMDPGVSNIGRWGNRKHCHKPWYKQVDPKKIEMFRNYNACKIQGLIQGIAYEMRWREIWKCGLGEILICWF